MLRINYTEVRPLDDFEKLSRKAFRFVCRNDDGPEASIAGMIDGVVVMPNKDGSLEYRLTVSVKEFPLGLELTAIGYNPKTQTWFSVSQGKKGDRVVSGRGMLQVSLP